MKQLFLTILFCAIAVVVSNAAFTLQQTATKQKAKSNISKFIGKWKGAEKCNDASAPVAVLVVTLSNPPNVILTGIYSIQGQIKGNAKGDASRQKRYTISGMSYIIHTLKFSVFSTSSFSKLAV